MCEAGDSKFFFPVEITKSNLKFEFINDFDDWEAVPYKWCTPLAVSKLIGTRMKTPQALAFQTGCPEPLLKAAARKCFWTLGGEPLNLALTHLRLPKPTKVIDKIISLVNHLLGPLTDKDLLNILRLRVIGENDVLDLQ